MMDLSPSSRWGRRGACGPGAEPQGGPQLTRGRARANPVTAMPLSACKIILVVDDDVDVRVSLSTLLGLFDLAVDTACDGRSALDYLRDHPAPCLIILDLRMAGMGGLEFLAARS